jgi:hypothetical protein
VGIVKRKDNMAIIRTGREHKTITHEQGLEIWCILSGKKKPTDEQEKFCSKIDGVYLNYTKKDVQQDYIDQHIDNLKQMNNFNRVRRPR